MAIYEKPVRKALGTVIDGIAALWKPKYKKNRDVQIFRKNEWPRHNYRWPPAKNNPMKGLVWYEVPGTNALVMRKVLDPITRDREVDCELVEFDVSVCIYGAVQSYFGLKIKCGKSRYFLYLYNKSQMDNDFSLKPYTKYKNTRR